MVKRKRHQVIAFRVTERERAQVRAKVQKAEMPQQEYLLRAGETRRAIAQDLRRTKQS